MAIVLVIQNIKKSDGLRLSFNCVKEVVWNVF